LPKETSSNAGPIITTGLYERLVNSIVDYAVFMLDAEGRVTTWNPGAERIKGYKAKEIVGQHFSRFYTPEDWKPTSRPKP